MTAALWIGVDLIFFAYDLSVAQKPLQEWGKMTAEILHVVACVANPLRWQSRITLARAAIADWLKEPNVHVTLAECVYGSRGYNLADLAAPASRISAARDDDGVVEGMLAQYRDFPPTSRRREDRDIRRRRDLPPRRLDGRGAGGTRSLSGHSAMGHGLRPRTE